MEQVDLLLLNASNYANRPIYPYAFVQLSAIARHHDLTVRGMDLLNTEKTDWPAAVQSLLEACQPRMIGITLRQVDSIFYPDYYDSRNARASGTFFPVDETFDLIRMVRQHSKSPIVIGGIGFTLHAEKLFDHFGVDYGMQGDPDALFEHFDDVVQGRHLQDVLGLIYRDGEEIRRNERGYYQPSGSREYDREIIDEMVDFYGEDVFRGDNPPQVAVEIMRGCPGECHFCVEPHAKGKEIRTRSLAAIEEELDFLLSQEIRSFWFVCSELNGPGIEFAVSVAKIVAALAERHPGPPIRWTSYGLPTIERDDLKVLLDSGFTGLDLNDIVALDDDHLAAAKLPYRTAEVVRFLQNLDELRGESAQKPMLFMFLGNSFTDAASVRSTLAVVEENELRDNHGLCVVMARTRVFELDGRLTCEMPDGMEGTITSYRRDEEGELDVLLPTFHCPQYLTDNFDTAHEIDQFLYFVASTLLTNSHRARKNWNNFLRKNTTPDSFAALLSRHVAEPPGADLMAAMFDPDEDEVDERNLQAGDCLSQLFAASRNLWLPVLDYLGVPHGETGDAACSSYKLMELLCARYADGQQLLSDVRQSLSLDDESLPLLFLQWFLFKHNLVLRSDYRDILFPA